MTLANLTTRLLLLVGTAAAGITAVGFAAEPPCLMAPPGLEIPSPEGGLTWLAYEELSEACGVPDQWTRTPLGSVVVWSQVAGPFGSGRFWDITVGLSDSSAAVPTRALCLSTWTVGWRTLMRYERTPLPWVEDLDKDGEAELVIWDSFPLSEEPSMAEYGLVAWVYTLSESDRFVIDWALTRRMADELAAAYRDMTEQITEDGSLGVPSLQEQAAEALSAFAAQKCKPGIAVAL